MRLFLCSIAAFAALVLACPAIAQRAVFFGMIGPDAMGSGVVSCGATYTHCALLTVPSSEVGSGGVTNFPVLVSGTYSVLKVSGSGGQVLNTVTQSGGGASITVPADFAVTSDTCVTAVPFEWETYVSTTGAVNFWFKAASLSSSGSTSFHVCWGAAGVTTFQGNVHSTWNANFQAVYHLPNGGSLSGADSTSGANTLTFANSPTAVAGQVDGGGGFGTTSQYSGPTAVSASTFSETSSESVSAWFYLNSPLHATDSGYSGMFGIGTSPGAYPYNDIGVAVLDSGAVQAWLLFGSTDSTSTSSALGTGAWHYGVATYDGSTLSLYLDGGLVSAVAASGSPGSGVNYLIGHIDNIGGRNQNINVDEFEALNISLPAAWILTAYNNQSAPGSFYAFTVLN